jgi:hypothetical protein
MSLFESNRIELFRLAKHAGFETDDVKMSHAEQRLLNSCVTGEVELCNDLDEDQKVVRSKLLQWLLMHSDPRPLIHPRGITIVGAIFEQEVDLEAAQIDYPLGLHECNFKKDIILRNARTRTISLAGCKVRAIHADSIEVKGNVNLNDGFEALSEVRFPGAVIGGQLLCDGGRFKNPTHKKNPKAISLHAEGAVVTHDVFLRNGFMAEGEVLLFGALIGGQLSCSKGKFKNPEAIALNAGGIEVKGSVILDEEFEAEGGVQLSGSVIGCQLNCAGGKFRNPGKVALSADGIKIEGSVFLDDGFDADGQVSLMGAVIDGPLSCEGGKFRNPGKDALSANGIEVRGSVLLRNGFVAEGRVSLTNSRIKEGLQLHGSSLGYGSKVGLGETIVLDLRNALVDGHLCFVDPNGDERPAKLRGLVMLRHAQVGQLIDSPDVWEPTDERDPVPVALDGFTYNSLGLAEKALEVDFRIRWLERGEMCGDTFAPQPYTQLAKVLREAGHEQRSKRILIARGWKRLKRMRGQLGFWDPIISRLQGWLLGFGYRIRVPVICLLVLATLGWLVFGCVWKKKQFNPAVPFVYNSYIDLPTGNGDVESTKRHPPPYKDLSTNPKRLPEYPEFMPLVYSLDTLLPIVNLHQEDYWLPTGFGRWYLWFHIGLGWFFTTIAVVGFTGIIRKE